MLRRVPPGKINAAELTRMVGGDSSTEAEIERLWAAAAAQADKVHPEDLLVEANHGLTS